MSRDFSLLIFAFRALLLLLHKQSCQFLDQIKQSSTYFCAKINTSQLKVAKSKCWVRNEEEEAEEAAAAATVEESDRPRAKLWQTFAF